MSDLPSLSKQHVRALHTRGETDPAPPPPEVFDLPEKVLQFGSGRFLRGFVDYFIDKANRQGRFGGRVVIVQSTGTRRRDLFAEQDGLYTLRVMGLENGQPVETHTVIASVSRALSAVEAWEKVLACARNPELTCIVSNTTEVGITLDEADAPDLDPPRSFPGKLTAFLHARARAFSYAPERGVVVLPCELIERNGEALRDVVRTLAERWELEQAFLDWLDAANVFCNTLVDRIVTGAPDEATLQKLQERLGYTDALLTEAEVYRLWAIEGGAALRERLPFLEADPGIVVTDDVTPYRERKVRILNGTHTSTVPAAYLSGTDTVREALEDPLVGAFMRGLVFEEIVPSLDVPEEGARRFAEEVMERFNNPYIEHLLLNITFQSTTKMRHRVVPSILGYHRKHGTLPRRLLFGFACYLWFMRSIAVDDDGTVYGERDGERYAINDDHARAFYDRWQGVDPADGAQRQAFVEAVARDEARWGTDLSRLPGFVETVANDLGRLAAVGARTTLQELQKER